MTASGGTGEVMSEWPLVGRREELGLIAECLGQVPARSVVILAAAGVRKTRLAAAAAAAAGEAGAVVVPRCWGPGRRRRSRSGRWPS